MAGKVGRSGFGNIRKIWVVVSWFVCLCVHAFAPVQSANTKNMVTHIPYKNNNNNCFAVFMSH